MWNDDFHHAATVALTGRRRRITWTIGNPQESRRKYGSSIRPALQVAEEGARNADLRAAAGGLRQLPAEPRPDRQFRPRPTSAQADQPRQAAGDDRLHAASGTPMLFMGQEFAASAPFLYFADHPPDLGRHGGCGTKGIFQQPAAWRRRRCRTAMRRPIRMPQRKLDRDERSPRRDGLAHTDLLRLAARIPCRRQLQGV